MKKEAGTTLPNAWAAILGAITAIVALLLSLQFIDNRLSKLITGLAAIIIPAVYIVSNALHHQAKAREKAAVIAANAVTAPSAKRKV